jgi:RimJ/RimL family protein N-acetyltransferase
LVTVANPWPALATRLEGSLVVLEPLALRHEQGLYEAGRFPEIWTWVDEYVAATPERFHAWLQEALAASADGREAAFATIDATSERPLGSTRYLTLRPADRALEIGWTWLTPSAWSSGANAEAKLLMLEHAFERLDCVRVEFKTDARNERSRAALAALPAQFEGIFRKHRIPRGVGVRDSAYYSVIDDEWPHVKERLRERIEARAS